MVRSAYELLDALPDLGVQTAADLRRLVSEREAELIGWRKLLAVIEEGEPLPVAPRRATWPPHRRAKEARRRKRDCKIIRQRNAVGWTDSEIARVHGICRMRVGDLRRAMGLPHNAGSEWRRRQIGEATRQQCLRAGVDSLAEVRVLAFSDYARGRGWPADIRPRQVQILDVIYERGPMSKRQICDAIGMRWKGSSHKTRMASNEPGGSYLAGLLRRGLLVSVKRAVRSPRAGESADLYLIPLTAKRGGPWNGIPEEANAHRSDAATA